MYKSALILIAIFLAITSSGCTQDHDTFELPRYQATPIAVTPPAPPPAAPPPKEPPPAEPPPAEPPPVVPPSMPPADVSGLWFSRTETNAVNCGLGEYVDGKSIFITQDQAEVSLLTSTGDEFIGSVNGDIVEWTGSFQDNNGMSSYTSASLTVSADTGSGNASWTWTDGVDSCNGTMAFDYHKNALGESSRNSSPQSADLFVFTDNVAFFHGSLGVGIDKYDYYSFIAESDGAIQIELSHFDTLVTNLDLDLIDEDLKRIARSDSLDGFEMIDAPVVAGSRYYIRVKAESISDPDTYNLAVDFN